MSRQPLAGRSLPASPEEIREAEEVIASGELEVVGLLPRASNSTFLARACAGDREAMAVYKPVAGETPLWDFPDGSLAAREAAAYLVARCLGWPGVPPTVLRDGPQGPGAVQLFVEMDPRGEHYFTLAERRADDFRDVALFDLVVNNADRKSGHCLLDVAGRVFVIDHGVCFHQEPKLRTVIWEFAGEAVPSRRLDDVERLEDVLARGELRRDLSRLLSAREVDAMAERVRSARTAGVFPHPGPGRPYPWPPV